MHPEIEKFCQQLDNLKLAIKGNGSNQFPNMNEGFSVRLTPNDLCAYIEDFVQNIKSKNIEDLIPQFLNLVQKYTVSSNKLAVEIVPHIHNGNAAHAIPSLMISLSVIKENLAPLFGYYVGLDADINPTEINRVGRQILSRVRRIEKNLVDEEKAFASISDSVNKLNSASELADLLTKKIDTIEASQNQNAQLNTKLIEKIQSLEAEHENIKKIADAIELYKNNKIDEIDKILTDTSGALNDLNNLKQVEFKKIDDANNIFLKEKNEEIEEIKRAIADLNRQSEITLENADKLVAQATTASLAHSFDEQAIILRKRTFWWSVSLAMALGIAAVISVFKFYVTFTTGNNNIEFNQFLYQAGTSLILISPFIWFSWLATKQIGNLFRLSEDYQFKASVAKSYEGYRKQAASIDREFEKTLFASALKRFDQEPLRHVETHVHGSPVTEFIREWLKGKNVKDEGQIEKLSPVKNQSEE